MLEPDVRNVLESTAVAHLATILPDGGPHTAPVWIHTRGDNVVFFTGPGSRKGRNLKRDPRVAISIVPPDNPYEPVVLRGRVIEWIDGDAGWAIVDEIATKYIGGPYTREFERVALIVEVEHQSVGIG